MEFKQLSTQTVTVFLFEDNSAVNPGKYKVVWETSDHHKNSEVTVWILDPMASFDNWIFAKHGIKITYNFITPSTYESRRILNQYIK